MGLAVPFLFIVALCRGVVEAKILTSSLDRDVRNLAPLSEPFGFADGGSLRLRLSNVKVFEEHNAEDPNFKVMGFFMSAMDADTAIEADPQGDVRCILQNLTGNHLPTFADPDVQKLIHGKLQEAQFDYIIDSGGLFSLYFANCEKDTPVSFDLYIEMYNTDANGKKYYLGVGEVELEALYWVMFGLFTLITAGWAGLVWQERAHAQRIHYLMGVLCLFKALTVLSQALMTHQLERTGHADGWNIAFYVFTFFRGILFFTVIVLIGTGWSYMKPFLGDREKRILMVVIPLQVFANIAIIVMDEESPAVPDWFTWRDVFHLVDIVCCCALQSLFARSIKHLREASQTDGKAAINLEKLQLFRQFYIIVVVYIYFTRIVVYLLRSTMDYDYEWVSEAADQLATLAFYIWTAVSFRPHAANPYLRLQTTESEIEL